MANNDKCCETCLYWLPMGGCEFGGTTTCEHWKLSLSYEQHIQLELF